MGKNLASRPVALAKSLTWRGLTTTTGNAAAAKADTMGISMPPEASSNTGAGFIACQCTTSAATPDSS